MLKIKTTDQELYVWPGRNAMSPIPPVFIHNPVISGNGRSAMKSWMDEWIKQRHVMNPQQPFMQTLLKTLLKTFYYFRRHRMATRDSALALLS